MKTAKIGNCKIIAVMLLIVGLMPAVSLKAAEKPKEYTVTFRAGNAGEFDTDDFEERYQILVTLKDEITDLMINNIAVVLDVVIPEGDTEYRYEELKRCFRTKQRYENSRLR